jgi:hypothetical protein
MTAKSLPADHGAILEMRFAKFARPVMMINRAASGRWDAI